MKYIKFVVSALLMIFMLSEVTLAKNQTGTVRTFDSFDGIALLGSGNAEIIHGNKNEIIIQASEELIPYITTEIEKGILKIGTAGSWVKPSSGYSFKKAEKSARTIIQNIIAGSNVDKGLYQKKYNIYDTLFLDVLNEYNELGEALFTTMYQKNAIQDVFSFLDEETSIAQDIATRQIH